MAMPIKSAYIKIFISLICADFLLILLTLIFPQQGVALTEEGKKWTFVSWESWITPLNDQNNSKKLTDAQKKKKQAIHTFVQTIIDTTVVASDTIPDSTQIQTNYIENPEIEGKYSLDDFFEALYRLKKDSTTVRIAHYGDSQIEGDRITQFLRANFQHRFGGSGLGFIPIDEPASHHAYIRQQSSNWHRHTVFHDRINNGLYGLGGTVFRFQPPLKQDTKARYKSDSLFDAIVKEAQEKTTAEEAWVKLTIKKNIHYDSLQILTLRHFAPVEITIKQNEQYYSEIIPPKSGIEKTSFSIPETEKPFKITFNSTSSPYVAGVFLEGKKGVQVDNYSLRGHSGNGLSLIDFTLLHEWLTVLNTKLIIFQYGGNIVPYEVANFKFLEEDIVKMIERFKKAHSGVSILIVGVGDMARKVGDTYESYPSVEKIRDAQRRAAQRTGVAFWDLYETMGGKNTIVEWVNSPTPLAAPDYAHLSYYGQKKVSGWLFKALMNEYELFLKRKKIEESSQIKKPTL